MLINEYNHKHWAETIGSFLKVGSEYLFHTWKKAKLIPFLIYLNEIFRRTILQFSVWVVCRTFYSFLSGNLQTAFLCLENLVLMGPRRKMSALNWSRSICLPWISNLQLSAYFTQPKFKRCLISPRNRSFESGDTESVLKVITWSRWSSQLVLTLMKERS